MDNGKSTGKDVGRAYRCEMDRVALDDGMKDALKESVLARVAGTEESSAVDVATASSGSVASSAAPTSDASNVSPVPLASPAGAAAPKDAGSPVRNGLARGRSTQARRPVRWAVALAAAGFVLLTGFTVGAQGQDLWRQWFRSSDAAERAAAVGVQATDEGVTVEVVSAISDANHAYFLVEAHDEGQGLLDDHTELAWAVLWANGRALSTNQTAISYDEERKTVSYVLTSEGPIEAGAQVELPIEALRDQDEEFDVVVSAQPVSELVGDTPGTYRKRPTALQARDGEIGLLGESMRGRLFDPDKGGLTGIADVLASGDLNLPVEGDPTLSVVGVDLRDGVLHVLTRSGGVDPGNEYPYLKDPATGEVLEREYSISYYYGEDGTKAGGGLARIDDSPTWTYTDSAFYPASLDKLDRMELCVHSSYSAWQTKGTWNLSFIMPSTVASDALESTTHIPCEDFGTIEAVTVTPFSIGFLVHDCVEEKFWDNSPEVSIVYQDGRTVEYPGVFHEQTWDSEALLEQGNVTLSSIGSFEDYEDIAALIINGTRVDFGRS
ncbi:hypothetical protein [uncultured Adlercreutzia sp.]|uniref:hypothetical protein n=1 Tax=uncultured Adlercreutzia sp. TaxID=875803 RepID=UPI00260016F8|nr:hypothetical protein [uncultured Adlercreutzia sp.]MCI9262102.1 hypothetical protein [Eggerthellaceae bacterium]